MPGLPVAPQVLHGACPRREDVKATSTPCRGMSTGTEKCTTFGNRKVLHLSLSRRSPAPIPGRSRRQGSFQAFGLKDRGRALREPRPNLAVNALQ